MVVVKIYFSFLGIGPVIGTWQFLLDHFISLSVPTHFDFHSFSRFPRKCDLGRWASNLISTKDSFWETFENGFHFIAGQSILDSFSTPSQTRIQFLRFWIKILDERRVISPGTFLTRITQDIFFPKGRKFITKKSPESVKA